MSKVFKIVFFLSAVCLIDMTNGCRGVDFKLHSEARPEDEVIRLDKREPSPVAKDGHYRHGEKVTIIDNDGSLIIGDEVDETCGDLAFVKHFSGREEWLPAENSRPENPVSQSDAVEKTASNGYRFAYGSRLKYYKYFPAEQVFPLPQMNYKADLKVGDTVFENAVNGSAGYKGIVTEIPAEQSEYVRVRFSNWEPREVKRNTIFFVEPLKPQDLTSGALVLYNQTIVASDWAMVIGRRGDKIIIRERNGLTDIIVDISKLYISR